MTKTTIARTLAAIAGLSLLYLLSYIWYRQASIETAEEWSSRNNGFPLRPYVRALEVQSAFALAIFYPLLEIDREVLRTFVEYRTLPSRLDDASNPEPGR